MIEVLSPPHDGAVHRRVHLDEEVSMTADEVSMTADGALMIDAEALMIGGGVHMCLLHHHHHLHRILVMSHTAIIASRWELRQTSGLTF